MVPTSPIQFLTGTPFSSGQRKPASKTDCLLSTNVHSRWPSSRFSRETPARQRATRRAGRQASSDVVWALGPVLGERAGVPGASWRPARDRNHADDPPFILRRASPVSAAQRDAKGRNKACGLAKDLSHANTDLVRRRTRTGRPVSHRSARPRPFTLLHVSAEHSPVI